ncbi:hypothetical protein OIU35_18280 [Boseaceae bacterium BT-24-1]|nr:hypothetical protein [Boseaceae bacterium BT-24-1]
MSLLIGSPISQVLAPGRMTALMRQQGFDGILVPLEVPADKLALMVPALQLAPNVDSILVTLPHKAASMHVCGRLSKAAVMLGAVNATRRAADGIWEGDNFDGAGMLKAIEASGRSVAGARIHMVGAGAAATSIAVSLLTSEAGLLTFNDRDPSAEKRLQEVVDRHFPGRARAASVQAAGEVEILVNASHCGLRLDDPLPVPVSALHREQVVADVITDPLDTPFLREAKSRGALTVTGGDMLDGQLRLLFDFIRGAPSIQVSGQSSLMIEKG